MVLYLKEVFFYPFANLFGPEEYSSFDKPPLVLGPNPSLCFLYLSISPKTWNMIGFSNSLSWILRSDDICPSFSF